MTHRRDALQLLAVLALVGRPAARAAAADAATDTAAGDAALRAALDALARQRPTLRGASEFTEALASLARFDAVALAPSAAADLATVRMGLALDAALAASTAAGDAARAFALRVARAAGERADIAQLQRRLEAEMARLLTRARRSFDVLGLRDGSIGERYRALATRDDQRYTDDTAGRDALVADLNGWVARARGRLPRLFDAVPAWCLDVRVEQLTVADLAANRPGYRQLPARRADGTTVHGAYVIDLRDMHARPRFTVGAIAPHELLPGHLLQLPLEAAAGAHPLRVEYLSAFSEGWATYAEDLMDADGLYRSGVGAGAGQDVRDDRQLAALELGATHWMILRALRGLLDIQLALHGWSAERALAQLRELQGVPAYFAPFEADVARMQKEPAHRTAEALVWLRLRELSTVAARRGGRFDFHRRVLQHGRQPLARLATH